MQTAEMPMPRTAADYDILMKTIVIGDSGVGKSSLLHRYINNDWSPSYIATIGVDFKIDTFECMGKVVKLQLWDTAGHERFKAISSAYYRGSHCILLCYDVTDRETFENVAMWIKEVKQYARDDVPMALVGTKCDMAEQRQVSAGEAADFAGALGIKHYETSSKMANGGVHSALRAAVQDSLAYRMENMTLETRERKKRMQQWEAAKPQEGRSCLQRFRILLGF